MSIREGLLNIEEADFIANLKRKRGFTEAHLRKVDQILTYLKAEIEKMENPHKKALEELEFDSGEITGLAKTLFENDIETYDRAIQDILKLLEE